MKYLRYPVLLIIAISIVSCSQPQTHEDGYGDPLPSWNETKTKQAILSFVEEISNPASESFVAIPDRIAVFDNDGTLWAEQPMYFQLFFGIERIKDLASEHPEWKTEQPFKAILENDMEALAMQGEHGLLEIVMASHTGNTTEEFETLVKEWIKTAQHPQLKRPFTDLVYQPMLELIAFLQAHDFKVFIVSGGGIEFMRPWVEEVYGIPRHQVVGSKIKAEFIMTEDGPVIRRLPELDFINDKEGKPLGIHQHIGRKPIFCAGNSDGDLAMMQWTDSGEGKRFMLYLHHTDAEREWAYDRESHIGRLDKGLDEAEAKGWTVIDMKEDWKVIYPFQGHE